VVYDFIKPLFNAFYPTYYDYEIKGLDKIPTDKAVVIACNHTNAFVDSVILGMLIKQRVRFYARGDVFKGKAIKWFLNQINMSPIYRASDGYGDARTKNEKIFEECRQRLNNNETLAIYPEGICIQEKRLVPLKRGLGHILFQDNGNTPLNKDVLIVPVGINYSDAKKFRSKALINIGDPFSLDKFQESTLSTDSKLVVAFTRFLEEKMRVLIVNIKDRDNDEMVEDINQIYVDQIIAEKKFNPKSVEKHFAVRKEIAEMVNHQTDRDPIRLNKVKSNIIAYIDQLDKLKLRDHLIRPESINNSRSYDFILEFFTLWIGLPIYGLGLILNFPPYNFAKNLTEKKVKHKEFKASMYLNIAMFAWYAYYGIQLLMVGLIFRDWLVLGAYAVAVPLLGFFVLRFYPKMKKIFGRWALLRLARKDRKTVENIMGKRSEIVHELNIFRKEYHQSIK